MTFSARLHINLGSRIEINPSSWRTDAACRDADPDLFFPERGGFAYNTAIGEARKFCDRCPVRTECLDFGRGESYGIWGGKIPADRKASPSMFAGFCEVCDAEMYRKSLNGPAQVYCSKACKQQAYQMRRTG